MTQIDEKALADYEALCAGATPEPWSYIPGVALKHYVASANDDFGIGLQSMHPSDGREVPAEANARFVASSRTMGPLLAAKVRELEKELARIKGWAVEGFELLRSEAEEKDEEREGYAAHALDQIQGMDGLGARAKSATIEADGIHLAVMLDELAKDGGLTLDEDTRAAVDRLLLPVGGAAAPEAKIEPAADERLWAFLVADETGTLLLEASPTLRQHLADCDAGDMLTAPSPGLWFWEGTALWLSEHWHNEGNAAELTLEGTWTPATVANAITGEAPEPGEESAAPVTMAPRPRWEATCFERWDTAKGIRLLARLSAKDSWYWEIGALRGAMIASGTVESRTAAEGAADSAAALVTAPAGSPS